MSESIYEAYCVELDAIVTIEEAQEAYFAQEEPRRRFHFQCSDERCRNLPIPPEITGVNYSSEEYKRTPHFRRNENYEHDENCYWGVYNQIQNEILKNRQLCTQYLEETDKNLFRLSSKIESAFVPDKFVLRPAQNEAQANPQETRITQEMNNRNMRETIRERILREHNETSSFSKIVDVFEAMNPEDRKNYTFSLLNEPKLSYRKAFKFVQYAKQADTQFYIYYGRVKVKIDNNVNNIKGYKISFIQPSIEFFGDDRKTEIYAFAFISNENFIQRNFSGRLEQKLIKASQSSSALCYILSNNLCLHDTNLSNLGNAENNSFELEVTDIVFRDIKE